MKKNLLILLVFVIPFVSVLAQNQPDPVAISKEQLEIAKIQAKLAENKEKLAKLYEEAKLRKLESRVSGNQ
jgi:Na+-transporting methylmalonyl-CoA/oxaloacetate decarboxylase gamma subunit